MVPNNWLILATGGLIAGVLAGFLGIGGGTLVVPLLVALGYTPVQAVATSSLSIFITAISGTVQNWRMGYFSFKRIALLGFPALITAQIGVYLAEQIAAYLLLIAFGMLLLLNIYLVDLRKRLTQQQQNRVTGELSNQQVETSVHPPSYRRSLNPTISRLFTGSAAGLLAGLFGVGGGIIMVPLQILLLGEPIKVAIQTSLGVIVITAISACLGHALQGNVLWVEGILLGAGGLLGAQVGTRYLPKLPDEVVSLTFRLMLGILSIYIFWQAWNSYNTLSTGI